MISKNKQELFNMNKTKKNTAENRGSNLILSKFWGFILAGVLILGIAIGLLPGMLQKDKFAHIDTEKVFNSFKLTQEYQSRLANLNESRKSILQNLQLSIQDMESRKVSPDSLQQVYAQYRQKSEAFALDEQTELQQYNEQVLTQLRQYMQDFCQVEGYSFLFGSGSNGQLLGAAPEQDVTEELIAFVNLKYLGQR